MFTLQVLMSRLSRWSTRSSGAIGLGIAVIVVDGVALAGSSGALLAVGLVSLMYGVLTLAKDIRSDIASVRAHYEEPRQQPLVGDYEQPYDEWSKWQNGDRTAIHDPGLDKALQRDGYRVALRLKSGLWKPAGEAEDIRRLRNLSLEFDEDKIRLSSDLLAGTESVEIQKTKYSAFLVTNKLANVRLLKSREIPAVDAERVLFRNGRIPRLDRSAASNHIGVDVLVVTKDGRIWLGKQSMRTQLSPGLLAPTGSGSADWQDIDRDGDLLRTVVNAMRRELLEETGLPKRSVRTDSFRVLGYTRFTHLGGKPQFVGVARLDHLDPVIRGTEVAWMKDHTPIDFDPQEGIDRLCSLIDDFLVNPNRAPVTSFPLYVNLRYLQSWLRGNPAAASWLGIA